MKNMFLVLLLLSSASFANGPSEMHIGVKGMVCAFCAQGIEKKLKSQPEISKVDVSLEKKYVHVTFKEGKSLPKEKLTQLLKDAGYEAVHGE